MDSERLLPKDQRLNAYVEEFADEFRQDIDELQRSQEGNLLSSEVEFRTYESIQTFATLAYVLEKRVIQTGSMKAYEAMYRAAVFAFQIAENVHGDSTKFEAGRYIRMLVERPDGDDLLMNDVQTYLADNPDVSELLDYYIDEIDEGRNLQHVAELSAGMVFMLIERNLGEEFILEEANNCSVEELFEDE